MAAVLTIIKGAAAIINGYTDKPLIAFAAFRNVWSSCRRNDNNSWIFNGNNGYSNNNNFYNSYEVVPCANW